MKIEVKQSGREAWVSGVNRIFADELINKLKAVSVPQNWYQECKWPPKNLYDCISINLIESDAVGLSFEVCIGDKKRTATFELSRDRDCMVEDEIVIPTILQFF